MPLTNVGGGFETRPYVLRYSPLEGQRNKQETPEPTAPSRKRGEPLLRRQLRQPGETAADQPFGDV